MKETNPSHLFFFFVHNDTPENSQNYLTSLKKYFAKPRIYFSGNQKLISHLKTGKEIEWLRSVDELEAKI
ncbi:MAG: hypothetical protein ACR2FN_11260 [Chitinophagaceae bacterium]